MRIEWINSNAHTAAISKKMSVMFQCQVCRRILLPELDTGKNVCKDCRQALLGKGEKEKTCKSCNKTMPVGKFRPINEPSRIQRYRGVCRRCESENQQQRMRRKNELLRSRKQDTN